MSLGLGPGRSGSARRTGPVRLDRRHPSGICIRHLDMAANILLAATLASHGKISPVKFQVYGPPPGSVALTRNPTACSAVLGSAPAISRAGGGLTNENLTIGKIGSRMSFV